MMAIARDPMRCSRWQPAFLKWTGQVLKEIGLAAIIGKQFWEFCPSSASTHDGTEGDPQELLVSKVCTILGKAEQLLYLIWVAPNVSPHVG